MIPDGLLFRVSSIDRDSSAAFVLQDAFAAQMMEGIPAALRPRLIGRVDS
jgi:hypothetical protein